jgi:hypothetical protein
MLIREISIMKLILSSIILVLLAGCVYDSSQDGIYVVPTIPDYIYNVPAIGVQQIVGEII